MSLVKRIGDNTLNTNFVDGQTYQHTDVNQLSRVTKEGINENYYDIQRLQNGETPSGDTLLLDGAPLARAVYGQLVDDDNVVPTAQMVKNYVDLRVQALESQVLALEARIDALENE